MNEKPFEFHIERRLFTNALEVHGYQSNPETVCLIETVVIKTVKKGSDELAYQRAPFLSLSQTSAKNLMDELWHAGVRPSEYAGPSDKEDLKAHNESLQKIAYKLLEIDSE